jgi:hypothetical protein
VLVILILYNIRILLRLYSISITSTLIITQGITEALYR